MDGGEPGRELTGDLESFVDREAADAAQEARQILAVDVLHAQEALAVDLADVENPANIGMGDLACQADFPA